MLSRSVLIQVLFLLVFTILLYYPVYYSEYLFTDEAVHLWLYGKDPAFHMFIPQGRYITDLLLHQLFGSTTTVSGLKSLRTISLASWLIAVPIWFYIIRQIVLKEKLPSQIPFIAVIYLICSPAFSISTSWASCMELSLANTSGLLSGYLVYSAFSTWNGKLVALYWKLPAALVTALISLFTYQNGFGCFLIPFLLYLLARPGNWKMLLIGVSGYLLLSFFYYLLFKLQVNSMGIAALDRTGLHLNPLNKLKFFFSKPLTSAFRFNYLVTETSITGVVVSMLLLIVTAGTYFISLNRLKPPARVAQVLLIPSLLLLIYLPSLIVKENYASNRTMLALSMAVFLWIIFVVLEKINQDRIRVALVSFFAALFFANGYYNFRNQFLAPVTKEYSLMRNVIESHYKPGIDTLKFIPPSEDLFVKKYGITRSWDEFGVPSFFFAWTPEFFTRQIIFEKTGSREIAAKLTIIYLPQQVAGSIPLTTQNENVLVINSARLLSEN